MKHYNVDYLHHEILAHVPVGKKQEINRMLKRYRRNIASAILRDMRDTLNKHSHSNATKALLQDIKRSLEGLGFNAGKIHEKQTQ